MTWLLDAEHAAVAEAVAQHATDVEEAGPNHWGFRLDASEAGRGAIRVEEDWLSVRLPVGRIEPERLAGLLRINGGLAGGVKFGLAPEPPFLTLSAQWPLEADDLLRSGPGRVGPEPGRPAPARTIERIFAGLRQGLEHIESCGRSPDRATTRDRRSPEAVGDLRSNESAGSGDPRRTESLKSLLTETGWSFTERSSGRLAVELDVPAGFYQAMLTPTGEMATEQELRIDVELSAGEEPSPLVRRAAGVLLLTGCHAVRMARASLCTEPGRVAADPGRHDPALSE
ncbi:MAG: hypothetical protein ACREJB_11275, partial [Planctomycetaceae bacterium]